MTDPYDGLNWPLRIASAEVVVETGLPVQKTRDYVTLNFASTITMPDDTWVDWDATQQRFITAAEKYGSPQTAKIKSTVVYPQDLFTTVQWHDGSPLDVSDFVMAMILTFDRAKPASAIYDDSAVATYEWFMSHFKGVRIVSTNPLTIESYDDQYYLDAENCVRSWWPNYDYGPGAWHNLALGIQADAAHTLAFSVDKANQLAIDWMDFTRGNSLNILKYYLDSSALSNYIPYFNTLSAYITSTEAQARWARLQNWYTIHHNYWLGTGPFYLDTVSPNLRLKRFAQYPDQAGRWDFMAVDPILGVNYIEGAPGSSFTFSGSGYAPDSTIYILANNQQIGTTKSDADGNISVLLSTSPAGGGLQIASSTEEGYYMITAKRFLTAPLAPTELVWIVIDDSAPVRPVEGSGTVIAVPDGLAYTQRLYLPIGQR